MRRALSILPSCCCQQIYYASICEASLRLGGENSISNLYNSISSDYHVDRVSTAESTKIPGLPLVRRSSHPGGKMRASAVKDFVECSEIAFCKDLLVEDLVGSSRSATELIQCCARLTD